MQQARTYGWVYKAAFHPYSTMLNDFQTLTENDTRKNGSIEVLNVHLQFKIFERKRKHKRMDCMDDYEWNENSA